MRGGAGAGAGSEVKWFSKRVESVSSVLVVGGGALGIRKCFFRFWEKKIRLRFNKTEYAADIAEVYPNKTVTLLHSRHRLLPRFDEPMHDESELTSYYTLGQVTDKSS